MSTTLVDHVAIDYVPTVGPVDENIFHVVMAIVLNQSVYFVV